MISKPTTRSLIIVLCLIFLGKLLHSIYGNFFTLSEKSLLEIQQKSNNFIVLHHRAISEWNQTINSSPLYTIKKLEDSQIIEEYVYTNLEKQILYSISLEELKPLAYHIKIHSNEPLNLSVYFYKKIIYFPVIFNVLYDSFLWTFFLFVVFLSFLIILYLFGMFIYKVKKISRENLVKKIYKDVYNQIKPNADQPL